MCGIFGMVRNSEARYPERASAALIELGHLSVSRGRDSAGLAFIPKDDNERVANAQRYQAKAKIAHIGASVIVKDTVTFTELWNDAQHLPLLAGSAVVIGHTRAATQGSRGARENASPLAVGSLIGTHNGDVDTASISKAPRKGTVGYETPFGSTDTEILYRAIEKTNVHRKKITDILTEVEGRAALAWYDQITPNKMYLARAGLSPMATAWDNEGNFYWASNPDWFRIIDAKFEGALGFGDISMIKEGTLLTIDFSSGMADISDLRSFHPTVRFSDEYLSDGIVWREFTTDDKKIDKDSLIHKTTTSKYSSSYTAGTYSTHRSTVGTGGTTGSENSRYSAQFSDSGEDPWLDLPGAEMSWEEYAAEAKNWEEPGSMAEIDDEYEALLASHHITRDDVDAAIIAVEEYDQQVKGTAIEKSILEVLSAAKSNEDFEKIAKDYGLPNEGSARVFALEILESTRTGNETLFEDAEILDVTVTPR
jgi:glutamine---fructose-6-phosphate transaminase (isomerizing)